MQKDNIHRRNILGNLFSAYERKLKLTQEYVKAYLEDMILEVRMEAKDGSPETDKGRRKSDRRTHT